MSQAGKKVLESDQLATLVNRNIRSIENLMSTLPSNGHQYSNAASQLARLKLWAGSLGAHRKSGTRSLGYRLRDASYIRRHIISLLEQLDKAIEYASSPPSDHIAPISETHDSLNPELLEYLVDDDESDESERDLALADISHVVDCLYRLSVTISNPAPHDQFASRAGSETLVYYEQFDIRHVQEKFPQIETWLAKRLGRAISIRRQYFKYREDHHTRLVAGIDNDANATEGGDQTTIASSLPDRFKDSLRDSLATESRDSDDRSVVSKTSYAPSLDNSEQLKVPPVPNDYLDGPLLCPFCYVMIEINSRHDWKKHIFRDLQPYICLASNCVTQDHKFSRRSDWSRHMMQMHWRLWRCSCGCGRIFDSIIEFRGHLQESDLVNLTAKQQDTLERICSQPDPDKVPGDCPICTEVQISSAEQYFTHVGNHLEQLSLFALPQNVNHESESHNTQFEDNRDQKEASDTSSIIDPQDNSSHNIAKPESDDESQAGGQSSGDPGTSRIEISPPKAFDVYGELALRQVDETSYKRENVVNDSDSRRSLGDDILTGEPNEESGSTTDHSENHDRDITTAEQPSSNPKRTVDSAYSSGSSGSSSYRWDCCNCGAGNHSYSFNISCTICFHRRDAHCTVWATK